MATSQSAPGAKAHDLALGREETRDELLIHLWGVVDAHEADPANVEARSRSALERARRSRDVELRVLALRALAWVHRVRRETDVARALLDEAVRLARRHRLAEVEGAVRVSRAYVRQELGDLAGARRDLDRALREPASGVRAPDHARAVGRALLARSVLDHNAGRLVDAERGYRSVLDGPDLQVGTAVVAGNNLAMVLAERAAYADALRAVELAVRLAQDAGPAMLAPALQTRAWIKVRAGRLSSGMRDFERASGVYSEAGIPLGEYFTEYADAMTDLRLLPEAVAAAGRAEDEFERLGLPLLALEAGLRRARVLLLSGDFDGAARAGAGLRRAAQQQRRDRWRDRATLVEVEAALLGGTGDRDQANEVRRVASRLVRAGDLSAAVDAHVLAGRLAEARGDVEHALGSYAEGARLAVDGAVPVRVKGRIAAARAALLRSDAEGAVRQCDAGLRDLAVHRDSLPTVELRALASGHGAELGSIGLGVLHRSSTPGRVLAWMERTRALALAGTLPVLPASEVEAAPVTVDGQRVVASDWREITPGARTRATRWSLARLREDLDGRVLVELGGRDGRLLAVVVDGTRSRIIELGPEQDVADHLRALVFALRRMANPRGAAAAAAARASAEVRLAALSRALVSPLGVGADDELVVVPVGVLHGVPWSALHAGPVSLAPSASLWRRTAQWARDDRTGQVLVAGPDLVGAREEIDALRRTYPEAQVLGAQEATADAVVRALRAADIAHLACHGSLRADSPMFSSVSLADGRLTVQELHAAGAAPRRLVLASCHSGADVAFAGDEVLGFVSSLLSRGTAGVVASIAAVPDVEVVDLMLALHRRLAAGQTMARALHGARAEIDRETPAGFVNWCTFSAHGAA
ncbi:CHAT domain-containing protein [Cellulomonas sp. Sa3CUA2]|uniref:CHAT domain-containing protein n=1 Tax=Cellulomonas avistercoris TaxID=2762242 RepID=A0ABR8QCY5_9CELL|nr:CHAT domain-containing protein [Cellulomonas avistercoris]MBD7918289.1 CHAT domain-containing protein [Cellulomonas avistercoris]